METTIPDFIVQDSETNPPKNRKKIAYFYLRFLPMVFALGLSGCSVTGHGPHGGHTVSWYLHHQKAMRAQLAWCKNNAGRDKYSSCKNARKAEHEALGHNLENTINSL
ncbi:EexN family lipoprotein [Acidithiobacillus caldus]